MIDETIAIYNNDKLEFHQTFHSGILILNNKYSEVTAVLVRCKNQQEFFNIRPLLVKVSEDTAILAIEKMDESIPTMYEEPPLRVTLQSEGQALLNDDYFSMAVFIGCVIDTADTIKPTIKYINVNSYTDLSCINSIAEKYLNEFAQKLEHEQLELDGQGVGVQGIQMENISV